MSSRNSFARFCTRLLKLSLGLIGGLLLLGAGQAQGQTNRVEMVGAHLPAAQLFFIKNQGQLDPQVNYYLPAEDKTLYFTPSGVTLALTTATSRWVVKLDFVGGSAQPVGRTRAGPVVSYFRGSSDQWHLGPPTYTRLTYPDLWPGIDLVYTIRTNQLKYHFLIKPGADPAHIRLAYRGANRFGLPRLATLKLRPRPAVSTTRRRLPIRSLMGVGPR